MSHLPLRVLEWLAKQEKLSLRFLKLMMCVYTFVVLWALTQDVPLCR